jgi:hypothetical protein
MAGRRLPSQKIFTEEPSLKPEPSTVIAPNPDVGDKVRSKALVTIIGLITVLGVVTVVGTLFTVTVGPLLSLTEIFTGPPCPRDSSGILKDPEKLPFELVLRLTGVVLALYTCPSPGSIATVIILSPLLTVFDHPFPLIVIISPVLAEDGFKVKPGFTLKAVGATPAAGLVLLSELEVPREPVKVGIPLPVKDEGIGSGIARLIGCLTE